MTDYESVLLVKPEVFVYRIPPGTSNQGYIATEWSLDDPVWVGRMRLISKDKCVFIKLEDKTSGALYAECPIETYPGNSVEPDADSSRYFVMKIQDKGGRQSFIGVEFADSSDSFDLNAALLAQFQPPLKEENIGNSKEALTTITKIPEIAENQILGRAVVKVCSVLSESDKYSATSWNYDKMCWLTLVKVGKSCFIKLDAYHASTEKDVNTPEYPPCCILSFPSRAVKPLKPSLRHFLLKLVKRETVKEIGVEFSHELHYFDLIGALRKFFNADKGGSDIMPTASVACESNLEDRKEPEAGCSSVFNTEIPGNAQSFSQSTSVVSTSLQATNTILEAHRLTCETQRNLVEVLLRCLNGEAFQKPDGKTLAFRTLQTIESNGKTMMEQIGILKSKTDFVKECSEKQEPELVCLSNKTVSEILGDQGTEGVDSPGLLTDLIGPETPTTDGVELSTNQNTSEEESPETKKIKTN